MKLKLFFFVTLSSFACYAAEPNIVPMRKGEQAPFTGVLLSPEGVANTIADSEAKVDAESARQQHVCAEKIIKLEGTANQAKIKCDSELLRVNAQLESCKRMESEYIRRIEELEKNKPNVWLWFWSGVVGGTVLGGLTFFAISPMIQ